MEAGPDVGDASAADLTGVLLLLRDKAPGGANEFLIEPSVPGRATWITSSAGNSAGQSRRVSLGRSQRNTTPTTTSIRMPVRETVDEHATTSTSAQAHQRRWPYATREVEGKRHEHHKRGAQCDRMLRGGEDAQPGGAETGMSGPPASPVPCSKA